MHTNKTPHYELPQFIGSDVPNPLTDFNDAMSDIDTNMYQIGSQAADIASDVSDSQSDIADLQSQANLTDDNITLLSQQTQAARQAATDAQSAANTNAGNIATLTQSVANNRSSIANYNTRFNTNVPFKFGIEEIEDPDNPGQTIDTYGFYTNDDPTEFVPFGEAGGKIYKLMTIAGQTINSGGAASGSVDISSIPNFDTNNIVVKMNAETTSDRIWAGGANPVDIKQLITVSNNILTYSLSIPSGQGTAQMFGVDVYYITGNIIDLSI